MSTTVLILLILLAVYVPLYLWVWRSPRARSLGLQKYGPLIKINTKLGLRLMDRLGKYHRFWRGFGIASQILAFVQMAFMVFMIVFSVYRIPTLLQDHSGMGIEYVLALPGLNPIMPFWFTLAALIIALVFHEFSHGVQTRSNNMDVINTGALYCVVPIGAFVEPDEKQVVKASRTAKLDLYSAGISANFIIAAVAFLVFSVGMLGCVSNEYADNAAVYGETQDSPAYLVGIPAGAIILKVGGVDFVYSDDYSADTWKPGDLVTVEYITESRRDPSDPAEAENVCWGVFVVGVTDSSPASQVPDLEKSTIAYACHSGATERTYFYTVTQFTAFMNTTRAGEDVTFGYVVSGGSEITESTVTLDKKSGADCGYLGVSTNTAGMSLVTPGALLSSARNPLYNAGSLTEVPVSLVRYLTMPYNGCDPLPTSVQWWYGDNSPFFWTAVELFYWIFWLNILLGVTNALPAIPFDGGFIFQGWLDRLMERFGSKDKEKREKHAEEITKNLSWIFIFAFFLVILVAVA